MTATIDTPTTSATELETCFSASYEEFKKALDTVAVAVSSRTPLPILRGVLRETDEHGLTMTVFDYEIMVRAHVTGHSTTPGMKVLVEHEELTKLVTAMVKNRTKKQRTALSVQLTMDTAGAVSLAVNGWQWPVTTMPLEDYPTPVAPAPAMASLNRAEFTALVQRVHAARGRDETLPMLTGLHLRTSQHRVWLEATDRFRLAQGSAPTHEPTTEVDALVPGACLNKLLKHFTGEDLTIGAEDQNGAQLVTFTSGAVELTLRTLEESFPDTSRVVFTDAATSVALQRDALVTAVQQAAGITKAAGGYRATPTVVLQIHPEEHSVTVEPHCDEVPRGRQEFPSLAAAPTERTAPQPFAVDAAKLEDALSSFAGDSIAVHLVDGTKPMMVTELAGDLSRPEAYRHLVMPIRLPK